MATIQTMTRPPLEKTAIIKLKTKSAICRSKWCRRLLATLLAWAKSLNTLPKKNVHGYLNKHPPHWWKIRIQSEGGPSASPIRAECDAAGGRTGSGTEDWDLGLGFLFFFFSMRFTAAHHGFKESADQWIFQTSWVKGSVCCVKSQKKRQHEESGGVLHSDTGRIFVQAVAAT